MVFVRCVTFVRLVAFVVTVVVGCIATSSPSVAPASIVSFVGDLDGVRIDGQGKTVRGVRSDTLALEQLEGVLYIIIGPSGFPGHPSGCGSCLRESAGTRGCRRGEVEGVEEMLETAKLSSWPVTNV